MGMHAYAYFFKIFLPKELRSKDNSVGMSIPSAQILVSNIFPTRRNDDSLEKWLINMWEQSRYNVSVKYLFMPEIKEAFQK